jgi:type II secretory pathway component PulF
MDNSNPLNLAGLVLLGLALQLAVRIVYDRQLESKHDGMRVLLQVIAGVLVSIGLTAIATAFVGLAIFIAIPFALFVVIDALWSLFVIERQAVLEYLALAADKRIPFATAARAYALERGDILGWRCLSLANWLERGVSLPAALRSSGHHYGIGPSLAIGVGDELGCLPATLREAAKHEAELYRVGRVWTEIAMYFLAVSFLGSVLLNFYLIKFAPVIVKMEEEFDMSPPTSRLMAWFPSESLSILAHLAPLLALVTIFSVTFFFNSNLWPRFLPFLRPLDRAWVLRALAWGVDAQQSMPQILASITRHMPTGAYWKRLVAANTRIAAGHPWIDALRDTQAISAMDATLLAAAERVGNLSWVCRQRAQSYQYAFDRRLRWGTTLSLPLFLLMLSYFVFSFALRLFSSLAHIVEGLA